MNKKANNYLIIIMILLLVVAIIVGAGLCYLSWSDEYNDGQVTTEHMPDSAQGTESADDFAQAKEEGKQELLDSIQESLNANMSAEDILNNLLSDGQPEAAATPGPAPVTEEGLKTNTVKMEQIAVTEDGEYQYIQEGQVASSKGIDVSKYQKKIDWKKVASEGVEYAFIRVGCRGYGSSGTLIEDEYFAANAKGATDNGIKIGAYFFSQAVSEAEAEEEAKMVVDALKDYNVTYPVAIDIERVDNQKARQDALSVEGRTQVCIAFCEYIKKAGYIPMVYGDSETFSELLDSEKLADYDFWICQTDGRMTFPYEFAVWQYSHKGNISGISTDTNMSISLKEW